MRKKPDIKLHGQHPDLDNLIEKTKEEIEALKVMMSLLDDFNGRQFKSTPIQENDKGNQNGHGNQIRP